MVLLQIFNIYDNSYINPIKRAESIASLGEFLKKKEDIRKPTRYQQEVLRLTYEVVCFASSLIHWFKLVVDSTPSYKTGMPSIYASAIYDIPRDVCYVTCRINI